MVRRILHLVVQLATMTPNGNLTHQLCQGSDRYWSGEGATDVRRMVVDAKLRWWRGTMAEGGNKVYLMKLDNEYWEVADES